MAQKNNPQPSTTVRETNDPAATVSVPASGDTGAAAAPASMVATLQPGKGTRKRSLPPIDAAYVVEQQNIARKAEIMGTARQRLAQAADYEGKGEDARAEARRLENDAGVALFIGRTDNILSADDVTNICGDIFGWKGKGDKKGQRVTSATPDHLRSKTPYGEGEALRKRIVRAHAAADYVNDPVRGGGTFFAPFGRDDDDPQTVAAMLNDVRQGRTSLWTFYDNIGTERSRRMSRGNPAFNPARVMDWAAAYTSEGAADVIRSNPELRRNLAFLYGALAELPGDIWAREEKQAA